MILPAADALPSVFSAPKDQPPASRHLAYRHWSGIPGAPGCLVINAVMGPPINGRNSMGFTGQNPITGDMAHFEGIHHFRDDLKLPSAGTHGSSDTSVSNFGDFQAF